MDLELLTWSFILMLPIQMELQNNFVQAILEFLEMWVKQKELKIGEAMASTRVAKLLSNGSRLESHE